MQQCDWEQKGVMWFVLLISVRVVLLHDSTGGRILLESTISYCPHLSQLLQAFLCERNASFADCVVFWA